MKCISKIFVLLFLFLSVNVYSQDIHFSQTSTSPFNLNPALAGTMQADYRFVINNRSQWNSFTNAYKTLSASFDHKFVFSSKFIQSLGLGLLVNSDKAGDGKFGNAGIYIPFSYQKSFLGDRIFLTIGIQPGFVQNSIDYNLLSFGTQFNGNKYDSGLPSFENFSNQTKAYFDLSSGIFLKYQFKDFILSGGYALYHLNNPNISFGNTGEIYLPKRESAFLSSQIYLTDEFQLIPMLYYHKQNKYKELLWGSMLQIQSANALFHRFQTGLFVRNKDAVILNFAIDYNDIRLGVSYDINVSNLNIASKGRGGFEFSLVYLFNIRKMKYTYPPQFCPDYI